MTEPQRLLEGAHGAGVGDDFEQALLSSAKGDQPSERAMRRCLIAVGLGAAVSTAGVAGAATAVTSASGLAKASIPPAAAAATTAGATVTTGLLAKWIGIAAIGGIAAFGVASQVTGDDAVALQQSGVGPTVAGDVQLPEAPATPAEPTVAPSQEEEEAEEPADEPVAATPTEPARKPKAAATPAEPTASLSDEVAALDKARKRMEDDPDAALEVLDKYKSKFKSGALAQEAEVMRIESLARAGKKKQAKAAAAAFLAKHPQSPHAARVRALMK